MTQFYSLCGEKAYNPVTTGASGLSAALGNTDGQQNGVIGVRAVGDRVHPRLANQTQPPVQAVEKEPHVLDDIRTAPLGRRGLDGCQPALNVLFCLGHIQMLGGDIPGGGQALFLVLQPQKGPGVALGQPAEIRTSRQAGDSRRSRSLLARAEGGRPKAAAASSWVTPVLSR